MGLQVGVLSLSQLQLHDHYNFNSGGPINVIARAISANIRVSGSGGQSVAVAWAVVNRILILEDSPGSMTINFTLARAGAAGTVHGQWRIYDSKGVLLHSGIDQSTVAGPTVYSENIAHDLLVGSTIEFWGYKVGAGTICDLSDEELCFDATIVQLSRRVLTAPLVVTGAGILYSVVL